MHYLAYLITPRGGQRLPSTPLTKGKKMTRAMLGCTIVLTLGLTAHAQSFDPLYKPEPGDTVMVGWPESYGIPIGVGGMRAKLSFFGTIGGESPEMVWDMNRVSGHMEDGHTYLLKQGKRYRLHAGLKVKIK